MSARSLLAGAGLEQRLVLGRGPSTCRRVPATRRSARGGGRTRAAPGSGHRRSRPSRCASDPTRRRAGALSSRRIAAWNITPTVRCGRVQRGAVERRPAAVDPAAPCWRRGRASAGAGRRAATCGAGTARRRSPRRPSAGCRTRPGRGPARRLFVPRRTKQASRSSHASASATAASQPAVTSACTSGSPSAQSDRHGLRHGEREVESRHPSGVGLAARCRSASDRFQARARRAPRAGRRRRRGRRGRAAATRRRPTAGRLARAGVVLVEPGRRSGRGSTTRPRRAASTTTSHSRHASPDAAFVTRTGTFGAYVQKSRSESLAVGTREGPGPGRGSGPSIGEVGRAVRRR